MYRMAMLLFLCRCGPFVPALEALKRPQVKQLVAKMIAGVYTVSDGIAAFETAKSKGTLKVLVDMRSQTAVQ